MDNQKDVINSDEEVVRCWYEPIYEIFKTLLLKKNWKQQDLADFLSVDKSNISKICHGVYVPDLNLRLKIAEALDVDSSVIWRYQDLPYIKALMKNQKESASKTDAPQTQEIKEEVENDTGN